MTGGALPGEPPMDLDPSSSGEVPRPPGQDASWEDSLTLRRIGSPLLRESVVRVTTAWQADRQEGESADEVFEAAARVAERVERAGRGLEPEPDRPPGRPALLVRVAELLRLDLVSRWAEEGERTDPREVLDALAALETVRTALESEAEGQLATRLEKPDAFDLIVEVAHDLRSPLTSILFLSETLRRGHSGEINDLQHRQLGLIYSAALGLISVSSDVMELARGGKQLSDETPSPFSLGEILESVREMVQIMAEEKDISLRLTPPEGDQRLGYPVHLSRTLLNLTTNALKFTDEGVVEVVGRQVDRVHVEFSVRDTGRGIDPAEAELLFQPFRKSRGREGHFFSGSGLGLSIARRLVEAMGATLEFETRPGWGTRFYFTLHLPPAGT